MSDIKQPIIEAFATLDPSKQQAILKYGCEQAVAVWEDHTGARTIEYEQNGARLVLDTSLPRRSMDEATRKMSGLPSRRAGAIAGEWDDPLESMESGSLTFPVKVVAAYMAVHRLFLLVFEMSDAFSGQDVLAAILDARADSEENLAAWWKDALQVA